MDRRTFIGVSTAAAVTPIPALAAAPKMKSCIMPDIRFCEVCTKTQHDNCWTIHWVWMARWWEDGRYEVAHVNSRRYREWLVDYDSEDGIPPHIQFGGAVVAGEAAPTFHARWVEYAKATFI